MKNELKEYIEKIDTLLLTNAEGIDWEEALKTHLVMTGFFQHERLVHLIVTVTFAVLTAGFVLYAATEASLAAYLLAGLSLCLLIPYIHHYYFLENRVQYLYKQYMRLCEKHADVGIQSFF